MSGQNGSRWGCPFFCWPPIHYFLQCRYFARPFRSNNAIDSIQQGALTSAWKSPSTRRSLAIHMAALPLALAAAARGLAASNSSNVAVAITDGLSHSSEAIHQELLFNASPQRIYGALTNSKIL